MEDMKHKLKALTKLSHVIHMIRTSESKCKDAIVDGDWDTLNNMAEAWANPKDLEFTSDTLYVHGVDVG